MKDFLQMDTMLLEEVIDSGGGLWTDLVIEQVMMRAIKTRGGLTEGRGLSDNVILTWIHTMRTCVEVHNSMADLTILTF